MMKYDDYKYFLRGRDLPENDLERSYKNMIINSLRKYFDLVIGDRIHNIDSFSVSQLSKDEQVIRSYFGIEEHSHGQGNINRT